MNAKKAVLIIAVVAIMLVGIFAAGCTEQQQQTTPVAAVNNQFAGYTVTDTINTTVPLNNRLVTEMAVVDALNKIEANVAAKLGELDTSTLQFDASDYGKYLKVGKDGQITLGTVSSGSSHNTIVNEAVWGEISGDINFQKDLMNALNAKQNKLTAGSNITITEEGVISATGGGGGGSSGVSKAYVDAQDAKKQDIIVLDGAKNGDVLTVVLDPTSNEGMKIIPTQSQILKYDESTETVYINSEALPIATTDKLGGVKIKEDGGITLDEETGEISVVATAPTWSQVTNKPFSTVGTGLTTSSDSLSVDTNTIATKTELADKQDTANIVTSVAESATASNSKYPSEKAVRTELDKKVDNIEGKSLSTNDYTTAEKSKLAGIAEGAEVNVQSDWNVSDSSSDAYIANKPTIPTVVDILTSTSTTDALSANQGKVLNDALDGKQNKLTAGENITILNDTISATDTKYTAATQSSNGLMSSSDKVKLDTIVVPGNLSNYVGQTFTVVKKGTSPNYTYDIEPVAKYDVGQIYETTDSNVNINTLADKFGGTWEKIATKYEDTWHEIDENLIQPKRPNGKPVIYCWARVVDENTVEMYFWGNGYSVNLTAGSEKSLGKFTIDNKTLSQLGMQSVLFNCIDEGNNSNNINFYISGGGQEIWVGSSNTSGDINISFSAYVPKVDREKLGLITPDLTIYRFKRTA